MPLAQTLRFQRSSGIALAEAVIRLIEWRSDMVNPAKNTICLWYDRDAEDAARFYAKTFPDSSVGAVHHAPGDFPSGRKGTC